MMGWFIGQTVEAGIGGMVAAIGLSTDRLGRLTLYVTIFVIVAIIITILLQSIGFAPAANPTG
jgi:hypothetical protein